MRSMPRRLLACLAMLVCVAGCTTLERNPVPLDRLDDAAIPGLEGLRYWGDEAPPSLPEIRAEMAQQRREAGLPDNITVLALSGGADDGAFGAGLISAWTEIGTRPEFDIVTGVSTGALSAPFVFLGPRYDEALRTVYGGFPPERIFKLRLWIDILPKASVADSGQLADLIAQFLDKDMLAAIAREHRRGRRLLIQTSHLDAQRAVLWDVGAIAASGAPNALETARMALLASASVPVAFPPVLFEVEVDGQSFDEIHADGGVISESTVLSAWQPAVAGSKREAGGNATVYVIRNGRISPEPSITSYTLPDIAARAVSTLIKQQGVGDLLRSYEATRLRGGEFYVTWIGADFDAPYPGPFDPTYMAALFDYGADLMRSGRAWVRRPPALLTADERHSSFSTNAK